MKLAAAASESFVVDIVKCKIDWVDGAPLLISKVFKPAHHGQAQAHVP